MFLAFYAWNKRLSGCYKELNWLRVKLDHESCLFWVRSALKKTWRIAVFHFYVLTFGRLWSNFYKETIKKPQLLLSPKRSTWMRGHEYFESGRQNPQLPKCCVQCTACSLNNCKQWKRSRALKPGELQANNLKYKCVWVLQVGICFLGFFCFILGGFFLFCLFGFCFEYEVNWTTEIFQVV